MSVLTDLKARGVEDILITATDNLNGFTQTVKNGFLESTTQICVVSPNQEFEQIRSMEG
ncbi:transposase [Ichthyobacterium seriolicida]|uniref:Transposase n=1 Tax=Ichthyobacterium seriolicida TaxID=242600 RepID=A0A1J1E790_9FLAO|nr:transposase [Ichthyobacterium seriolicida]